MNQIWMQTKGVEDACRQDELGRVELNHIRVSKELGRLWLLRKTERFFNENDIQGMGTLDLIFGWADKFRFSLIFDT